MHRTQTEKLSVASNIDVSVIREVSEKGAYYAFVKISLFGMSTYGICTLANGYAFEVVGDDINEASELFELVLEQTPAVEHIFDIVTDFRRQKAIEE